MPASQLKRAEKAIEAIVNQGEPPLSSEVSLALQELLGALRSIEARVHILENNSTTDIA